VIRLLRLPILTTAAAAALLAVSLLPGGPVSSPVRAVNATPSATPPISGGCLGCVDPLDAICWEGPPRCYPVVVRLPPHTQMVTAYYRTVAMTAKPQIDYVHVSSGKVVIHPGQSSVEIMIQLLPNPTLTQDRTFGVELFAVSGAGLVRPMATITIKPARN
jgi:hypothetical protein